MSRANEAIVCEQHPIPTIEEIFYDLHGSTVFSNLDLRWGIHQMELQEKSLEIMFVTHRIVLVQETNVWDLFSTGSLPEGHIKMLSKAAPVLQILQNGLIVYRVDQKEHDNKLHAVLKHEKGLTLNREKCQFRLPKLTFSGHDLSGRGIRPSEEKLQL